MKKLLTEESKKQFLRVLQGFTSSKDILTFDTTTNTYPEALNLLWSKYKGKTQDIKLEQGFINMALTFYAGSSLDDLPVGSIGYVLGRKKSFNKHIETVFKDRGFIWEREDSSKATFFIVGDILTPEDNALNENLRLPIVMDIIIENEYHHKHSGVKYITTFNDNILLSTFSKNTKQDIYNLSYLLKFVHADALKDSTRLRLILHYLKCLKGLGYSYSDKKHKELIRLMRRLTFPEHQYLLEPKFANAYSEINYATRFTEIPLDSSLFTKDFFGYLYSRGKYSWKYKYCVPLRDGLENSFMEDIEANLILTNNQNNNSTASNATYKDKLCSWTYSQSIRDDYQGSKVELTSILRFCDLLIKINFYYYCTSTGVISLQTMAGQESSKSNYGGLTTSSLHSDNTFIKELVPLVLKHIEENPDIFKTSYIRNNGMEDDHIKPLKKPIIKRLGGFIQSIYGKGAYDSFNLLAEEK